MSIRTLPPEIVAKIFEFCLCVEQELHPSRAPILLTRVCREWRDFSLDLPQLWTHLVMPWVPIRQCDKIMPSTVNMWLSASACSPLDLTFENGSSTTATYLSPLYSQSRRWRHVKMDIRPRKTLLALVDSLPLDDPFSNMRSLELTTHQQQESENLIDDPTHILFERLRYAPVLESLTINEWPYILTKGSPVVLSPHLRHFRYTPRPGFSVDICRLVDILCQCDKIVTLWLNVYQNRARFDARVAKVARVPSLRTLQLYFRDLNTCSRLIGALSAVNLYWITLWAPLSSTILASCARIARLLAEYTNLQILELYISFDAYAPESLRSAIVSLPTLTFLHLGEIIPRDGIARLLDSLVLRASPDGSLRSSSLPMLETFHLSCVGSVWQHYDCDSEDLTITRRTCINSLADLVVSRWSGPDGIKPTLPSCGVRQLRTFVLTACSAPALAAENEESYGRIERCWSEGLGRSLPTVNLYNW